MEKWIKNNEGKLMLAGGIFILWCIYSTVHDGGSVIHRINECEARIAVLEYLTDKQINDFDNHVSTFNNHTHYYNGKPK